MTRSIVVGIAVVACAVQISTARAGVLKAIGHAIGETMEDAAKDHPHIVHGAKEGGHEVIKKGAEGAVEGVIKGASPSDDGDDSD